MIKDIPQPEHTVDDPPPPFEDVQEDTHLLSDFPTGPPPEFAPYNAESFDAGNGDIVSHDPHLNTDGEALYRFLLNNSTVFPRFTLHIKGVHSETKARQVTRRHSNDTHRIHTETYSETVTDFDFSLNLTRYLDSKITSWTIADSEPAYRGTEVLTVQTFKGLHRPGHKVRKLHKQCRTQGEEQGLPPWSQNGLPPDASDDAMMSSKTVREFCDEYCASPKLLKEFEFRKVVYGWKRREVENAVAAMIKDSFYQGELFVKFHTDASKIFVRPDNKLSRMLSNKWFKLLSIIFLIFPFIWLFKRFHSQGGGTWRVAGSAYAIKRFETTPIEEDVGGSTIVVHDSHQLKGIKESDWLQQWHDTIMQAVNSNYISYNPISMTRVESLRARASAL